jgi:hypothetical protein
MLYSRMWRHHVDLVRTDVSKEHVASNFRVERILGPERTLASYC